MHINRKEPPKLGSAGTPPPCGRGVASRLSRHSRSSKPSKPTQTDPPPMTSYDGQTPGDTTAKTTASRGKKQSDVISRVSSRLALILYTVHLSIVYLLLSRVSMKRMQSAILFYQFCLSVCPVPVLQCQNERTYRRTFLTFW